MRVYGCETGCRQTWLYTWPAQPTAGRTGGRLLVGMPTIVLWGRRYCPRKRTRRRA